jgi:intein-like protein with splicing domain
MAKQNIIWRPMPKQERFLSCPAFEVGYGGAKGGGKSDSIAMAPLMGIASGVSGYRALLLRRHYTDLEKSLIVRSHELYKGRASWDGQNKRWKFPNGCSIEFGHCKNDEDIHNYDSAQYSFVGIEQAEQFTEEMYIHFFSIVRTTNPLIKPKIRLTFNPGGVGHTWLMNRFWIHDKTHEPNFMYPVNETIVYPDGKTEVLTYKRAYIPATVFDNEHIMKNDKLYVAQLMAMPEPRRSAYIYGRFDLFEGQFFKEWTPSHVCVPFTIPWDWKKYISFDWGYGKGKMAMYWYAEDPKTRGIYVYRELYVNGMTDIEVAKEMDRLTGTEKIDTIFYPWDLDTKSSQTGISMKERMDDQTGRKYYWKLSDKDRTNGWMAVRFLLKVPEGGDSILKVFDTCKNLIRTLPLQVFDDIKPEDLNGDGEDHACFVAGTKVLTESGYKNIESIYIGDKVVTRKGLRKVIASGMTNGNANVFELITTNGKITATGNHPIFLNDGTKKNLSELKIGDNLIDSRSLVMIQLVKWKLKSSQKPFKNLTDNLIGVAENISSDTVNVCTGWFGNIITVLSLKASTFITKILTDQITKFQILSLFPKLLTCPIIPAHQSIENGQENVCLKFSTLLQENGMAQKLARNGTFVTEKIHGKTEYLCQKIANFVGENILRLSQVVLNFAISIAKWLTFVQAVKVLELRTLPTKQSVFNLSVEQDHEYIANGLLVSNCDALRYFAATFRPLRDLEEQSKKASDPVDFGNYQIIPKHKDREGKFVKTQYIFKKEPVMSMNWLGDY